MNKALLDVAVLSLYKLSKEKGKKTGKAQSDL
jgi:hypothetical protein